MTSHNSLFAESRHTLKSSIGCLTFLSGVDELSSVHALRSNHSGVNSLESVRIFELDSGKGGTSAGIVKDFLDYAFHIAVSLSEISLLHGDRTLSAGRVCLEDRAFALSTTSNDFSHCILLELNVNSSQVDVYYSLLGLYYRFYKSSRGCCACFAGPVVSAYFF
jgi:hypothetical protein